MIRGDLVRTDAIWQNWEFQQVDRDTVNQIKQADRDHDKKQMERKRRGRNYQTKIEERKP